MLLLIIALLLCVSLKTVLNTVAVTVGRPTKQRFLLLEKTYWASLRYFLDIQVQCMFLILSFFVLMFLQTLSNYKYKAKQKPRDKIKIKISMVLNVRKYIFYKRKLGLNLTARRSIWGNPVFRNFNISISKLEKNQRGNHFFYISGNWP